MSAGSGSASAGKPEKNFPATAINGTAINEHARRRPARPLRPYIAWYTGYRQRGFAPAVHRGLPSPFLTLIITLDEPLSMLAHADPAQPPGDFVTLLGGLHSVPALITHDGAQSGIQVALRPLGSRALLGLPAGELADIDVTADSVLGSAGTGLRERILAAPDWESRFAVLDEVLLGLVAGLRGLAAPAAQVSPEVAPEVAWAWARLLRAGGDVRVSELADQTGWSARHLNSRFRTEIGLTPKAAARVVRFSRARRLLAQAANEPPSHDLKSHDLKLADLAVECGYFDQAHLAREFRSLAGLPPSRWLAEEFRNVQDPRWLSEATWVDQAG